MGPCQRFKGVATFTEWRRRYPAEVGYRLRRITAREDLVVVEVSVSYNRGPWQYGVQLLYRRMPARRPALRSPARRVTATKSTEQQPT
jgi:hypothetical protein